MNVIVILMLGCSVVAIGAAAFLAFKQVLGWYWFLITGIMMFMMCISFVMATQVMESIDLSEIQNTLINKEKSNE